MYLCDVEVIRQTYKEGVRSVIVDAEIERYIERG